MIPESLKDTIQTVLIRDYHFSAKKARTAINRIIREQNTYVVKVSPSESLFARVQEVVESVFNLPPGGMNLDTRRREVVWARFMFYYVLVNQYELTQEEIATYSLRNRSNISHALKTCNRLNAVNDKLFQGYLAEVKIRLKNSHSSALFTPQVDSYTTFK